MCIRDRAHPIRANVKDALQVLNAALAAQGWERKSSGFTRTCLLYTSIRLPVFCSVKARRGGLLKEAFCGSASGGDYLQRAVAREADRGVAHIIAVQFTGGLSGGNDGSPRHPDIFKGAVPRCV